MSALLDHLYNTMPTLPALVYFARKMNASEGIPDSKENTIQALMATLATVSVIDYEVLEHANLEYLRRTMKKKEEPVVPDFLKEQAERVHEQLELINSLDQKLTKALKGLEERMEQVKQSLGEGANSLDSMIPFQPLESGDGAADSHPFESLFKDQPLWEMQREPSEGLEDLERIPLVRQTAVANSKTLNL